MSEKNYRKLRQQLGYKPSYGKRDYRLTDKIIEILTSGRNKRRMVTSRQNVGAREVYRQEKKKMRLN